MPVAQLLGKSLKTVARDTAELLAPITHATYLNALIDVYGEIACCGEICARQDRRQKAR